MQFVVAVCAIWTINPGVSAQVDGIATSLQRPLAVRGGVLMLPLTAERHGVGWPRTIDLRLDDATTIEGMVIWIEMAPPTLMRRWTDDPRAVTIRAVRDTDDSTRLPQAGGLGPWLIARLPVDGAGNLRLNRQTMEPIWIDRPETILGEVSTEDGDLDPDDPVVPPAAQAAGMAREPPFQRTNPSPARPDPASPLEYWRWMLLADRLNMAPPSPDFDDVLRAMVAEHEADRWRVGLHRIAQRNREVAVTCRDLLTRTCVDRLNGVEFAAWETDPESTSYLLSRLLDFSESDRTVVRDARAWADSRTDILIWPAHTNPDSVELAMVNAGHHDVSANFEWTSAPGSDAVDAVLPAGVLTHVRIERPAAEAIPDPAEGARRAARPPADEEPPAFAGVMHTLEVRIDNVIRQFSVAPPVAVVRPPRFEMQLLRPPFTLHDVRSGQQRVMPPAESTFAQVRRRAHRWELFIDCRRSAPDGSAPALPPAYDDATQWEELRAIEAVTLFIEPAPGNAAGRGGAIVAIPENGPVRFFAGANDGTFEVHRRSFADRWLVRIVIPDAWISPFPHIPTQLGLIRLHAGSDAIESAPATGPPWRIEPGRYSLDLTRWDDLPSIDE